MQHFNMLETQEQSHRDVNEDVQTDTRTRPTLSVSLWHTPLSKISVCKRRQDLCLVRAGGAEEVKECYLPFFFRSFFRVYYFLFSL